MSQRKREPDSIENLMKSFVKENNLTKGMQKLQIEEIWTKLMGAGVAAYTTQVQLQNKTLIVKLTSSVLREELGYGKEKIIQMINEELGEKLVSRLMLVWTLSYYSQKLKKIAIYQTYIAKWTEKKKIAFQES